VQCSLVHFLFTYFTTRKAHTFLHVQNYIAKKLKLQQIQLNFFNDLL